MELLNALDAISGWQLTPEQRHAIFTLQATLTTLELGYQVQEKQIAFHTQAIRRQRHMICQLLTMIGDLKKDMSEMSNDLQWHHHDDEIQEIGNQLEVVSTKQTAAEAHLQARLIDVEKAVGGMSFEDAPDTLRARVEGIEKQCDTLNESVELLTEAIRFLGDRLDNKIVVELPENYAERLEKDRKALAPPPQENSRKRTRKATAK